jgi:hypothetical protein
MVGPKDDSWAKRSQLGQKIIVGQKDDGSAKKMIVGHKDDNGSKR